MKKRILLTAVACAGLILSACCSCKKGSPKLANLETDDWKLIEFQSEAVPDAKSVTLTFDPEKKMIYGKAPCNNFFTSYTLLQPEGKKSTDADNIQVGVVGATRKFCPNTEIEDGFGRVLPDVTRLKIEGDKLLMLDKTGNLVALLLAVPKTAQ